MEIVMWVFYMLTVGILLLTFCRKPRERLLASPGIAAAEERLSRMEAWVLSRDRLCFLLILGIGIAVRAYQFCDLPRGQNQDGTLAGVEAWCLLQNGVDHWGHSWPTYFEAWGATQMSTLYSYVLIPFVGILGLTKLALRLPMLLMSITALVLVWDLARRMAGKGFALLALFAAAVNPWQILQSRWALEANFLPHLLLLAVWLL